MGRRPGPFTAFRGLAGSALKRALAAQRWEFLPMQRVDREMDGRHDVSSYTAALGPIAVAGTIQSGTSGGGITSGSAAFNTSAALTAAQVIII